jgi:TolB-like protein
MADDQRLDGWKAIGNFLGRDRTTAIRWMKERGLPVHRVPGGRTGTVYALRTELNDWLARGDEVGKSRNEKPGAAVRGPLLARRVRIAAALGCTLTVFASSTDHHETAGPMPISIAAIASEHDDVATQRFARDLTADLARFANASAGLAVYDQGSAAARRAEYSVGTDIEGGSTRRMVRVWLTARDGSVLWSRRIEQSTSEIVVLRERVAANVVAIVRCGLSVLAEERADIAAPHLALLLSTCQAVLDGDYDLASERAREFTLLRPDLATGWAMLALGQAAVASTGGDRALRDRARASAAHAARIAPALSITHLAVVAAMVEASPSRIPAIERALVLHPNDPKLLRQWSVMLFNAGYVRASVEPALRAVKSDPTWLSGRDMAVRRLGAAGRFGEAFRLQRENEHLWPGHPQVEEQRSRLMSEYQEADGLTASGSGSLSARGEERDELERRARLQPYLAYAAARGSERVGDRRGALTYLARAPVGPSAYQQWSLLFWPAAADLRTERAFFHKMAQLGLVKIWMALGRWPDFCSETKLRYNCVSETAKLGMMKSGVGLDK